jgi:ABC-type metal ion transport system substrate-binding protein
MQILNLDVFLLLSVNSARKMQNLLKAHPHPMKRISEKMQNIHLFNTSSTIIFTDDDSSSARSLEAVKLSIQVELN